jgi:hypothetical protein
MTNTDIAIDILRASNDGNRLEPSDLKLVELGVNGFLSEQGEVALSSLRAQVLDGSYFELHRWFHGIEHLTRDYQGYLYWNGAQVEHYSFGDLDRERAAALELAKHCRQLDAIGIPVNSRTALSPDCYGANIETPWKLALRGYYSFFEKGADFAAIFFCANPPKDGPAPVFIAHSSANVIRFTAEEGAYEAYHFLQDQGFSSLGHSDSFEETVRRLERLGITSDRLDAQILGQALN